MGKYKRIFVVVLDSLGIGAVEDSPEYGDVGVDTLGHIAREVPGLKIPNLKKLGMVNLHPLEGMEPAEHPLRTLHASEGEKPWQGHHDGTLGDDGTSCDHALPDIYQPWFPKD